MDTKIFSTKLGIFTRVGSDENGNPLYSIGLDMLSNNLRKYLISEFPYDLGFDVISQYEARFTSYSLQTDINDMINSHSKLHRKS